MTPGTRSGGRLSSWRARAVWAVAILAVIVITGSSALGGSSAIGSDGADLTLVMVTLILAACVASFGFVGAMVAIRLPRNPIGWILWASAVVIAGSLLGTVLAAASTTTPGPVTPAVMAVAVLSNVALVPMLGIVGIFLPLLFPDGHLPSPHWRWVARGSAAAIAGATTLYLLMPGALGGSPEIQNPLGLAAFAGNPDAIGWLMLAILLVPFALGEAAVVARYRQGGSVERQQVKWFGGAVGLMFVGVVLGTGEMGPFAGANWVLTFAGIALLPIAVGIAVLRYRLYDIDRIISRTIGYAVVSGVLVAIFAGAILGFQAILSPLTQTNTLAVAASTLIVAILFQPLRRRVQRVVDRRFNRSGYDAEQTVAAFSARLRDETDLASLDADIGAVVRQTLAPASLSLWLHAKEAGN